MAYKVIKSFTDLQDKNFPYSVGDTFPREGMSVLPSRIEELSTKFNRRNEPLIVEVPEKESPKKKKSAKTDEN